MIRLLAVNVLPLPLPPEPALSPYISSHVLKGLGDLSRRPFRRRLTFGLLANSTVS